MEGNRDEAEKCVEIAREALNAGNREKAQRFPSEGYRALPCPRPAVRPSVPFLPPCPRATRPRPTLALKEPRSPTHRTPPVGPPDALADTPRSGPEHPGRAGRGLPETPSSPAYLRDAGSEPPG